MDIDHMNGPLSYFMKIEITFTESDSKIFTFNTWHLIGEGQFLLPDSQLEKKVSNMSREKMEMYIVPIDDTNAGVFFEQNEITGSSMVVRWGGYDSILTLYEISLGNYFNLINEESDEVDLIVGGHEMRNDIQTIKIYESH